MGVNVIFFNEVGLSFNSPELAVSIAMAILAVAISFLTAYLLVAI